MQSKTAAARFAARVALRSADLVLATSTDTLDGLQTQRRHGLRLAPLGVDTDYYHPRDRQLGVQPYVLTISQLTSDNVIRKRIVDVVRTAALIPDVPFRIVGRLASGESVVRDAIAQHGLGDRVSLLGQVSPEAKRRLLSDCAVYLQPTQYEAFGLAIAEAMACGASVVTTDTGAVRELVDGCGYVLAANDGPDKYAEAVTRLLKAPPSDSLRIRARQRIIDSFSLHARRSVVEKALADVMDASPPPA